MASPSILYTTFLLRILCLLALAASVLVMGLNNFTDDDGSKVKFTELIAYRYVFAGGCIGFVYTLVQVPFAMYDAIREKRLIRNGCLQEVDFYGDKIIAFLLASGVGVGFGVTFEFKRNFDELFDDKEENYFKMANISTGLLLVGFVFMAVLCIFSSMRHPKKRMFK